MQKPRKTNELKALEELQKYPCELTMNDIRDYLVKYGFKITLAFIREAQAKYRLGVRELPPPEWPTSG